MTNDHYIYWVTAVTGEDEMRKAKETVAQKRKVTQETLGSSAKKAKTEG